MANSKISISIGLLFFVFLSSHVLGHDEEREANHLNTDSIHLARATAYDNRYGGGGVVASQKDLEDPPPPMWQIPSKLNDIDEEREADHLITDSIHPARAAANNNHPPAANDNYSGGRPGGGVAAVANYPRNDTFYPPLPLGQTFRNRKVIGYNPSKLNDVEPENHEHGYVIKDDSTKPSEIDQRKSSIFMTKTTPGMRNDDKTSYSNLGVEDVGEQTIEDETQAN